MVLREVKASFMLQFGQKNQEVLSGILLELLKEEREKREEREEGLDK